MANSVKLIYQQFARKRKIYSDVSEHSLIFWISQICNSEILMCQEKSERMITFFIFFEADSFQTPKTIVFSIGYTEKGISDHKISQGKNVH